MREVILCIIIMSLIIGCKELNQSPYENQIRRNIEDLENAMRNIQPSTQIKTQSDDYIENSELTTKILENSKVPPINNTAPAKKHSKVKSNNSTQKEVEKWKSAYLSQGQNIKCYKGASHNKDLDNELRISMGDYGDLYVKLIDISSNKVIRESFIKKNSTYSIKNIPEGKYKIRTGFGKELQIDDKCNVRFKKQAYYKQGENVLNFNLQATYDGYDIPSFHLSLDVEVTFSSGSSYDSESISENTFNN